jgi:prefoldin subunit 5
VRNSNQAVIAFVNSYQQAFTSLMSPQQRLNAAREHYATGLLTLEAFEELAERLIRLGA